MPPLTGHFTPPPQGLLRTQREYIYILNIYLTGFLSVKSTYIIWIRIRKYLFVYTQRNLIKSNRNQIVFTIFQFIWKMVNTIWFQFDSIIFRKYFSVCTRRDTFWFLSILYAYILLTKTSKKNLLRTSSQITVFFQTRELFSGSC